MRTLACRCWRSGPRSPVTAAWAVWSWPTCWGRSGRGPASAWGFRAERGERGRLSRAGFGTGHPSLTLGCDPCFPFRVWLTSRGCEAGPVASLPWAPAGDRLTLRSRSLATGASSPHDSCEQRQINWSGLPLPVLTAPGPVLPEREGCPPLGVGGGVGDGAPPRPSLGPARSQHLSGRCSWEEPLSQAASRTRETTQWPLIPEMGESVGSSSGSFL